MKKLLYILVFVCSYFASSCATIIHGAKQTLSFSSTPDTAQVLVNGQLLGNTPMLLKLPRKKQHQIRIEHTGYLAYEAVLRRETSGWVLGNILAGGLIGLAVDAITGAAYKLTPKQIQAELELEPQTSLQVNEGIYLLVKLQPDENWEYIGQLDERPIKPAELKDKMVLVKP